MSIAWGSLVLLIVLLPGVLFFVGTYFPEQFTREAESRSPLGQLAGALLIAFLLHAVASGLVGVVCGGPIPCVSVESFLDTVNVDPKLPGATRDVGAMLGRYRWWIFAYVLTLCAAGIGLGAAYGWITTKRRIRGLSRHPWVHDLRTDGLTYAYVMTHIRQDDRILMYKGFLRAFGLQQDGRFSYVVLSEAARMYMTLGAEVAETSSAERQRTIGASSPGAVVSPSEPTKPRRRVHSIFVIEGEDIANVVFDVLATEARAVSPEELRQMIREEGAEIGLVFSEEELDELTRST